MNTKRRILTPKQLAKKVLYFAYGSNMHQPRLEERVGAVKCLGKYILQDFKLAFDTGWQGCAFANVNAIPGETCEGVIFEMTYGQLRVLDQHEGFYRRDFAMRGNRKLHYYISDNGRNHVRRPVLTMEYYAILMLGCQEHKLTKSLAIVSVYKPAQKLILWERMRIPKEE